MEKRNSRKNTPAYLRGFTLIELLVVIAIIGVLSSVVLAALNTARAKGNDAAVKGNLSTLQEQAAIYYDTTGSYGSQAVTVASAGNSCGTSGLFSDTNVAAATKAASNAGGKTTLNGTANSTVLCYAGGSGSSAAWMVLVPLSTDSTHAWCVDSNGNAKSETISGYYDTSAHVGSTPYCD